MMIFLLPEGGLYVGAGERTVHTIFVGHVQKFLVICQVDGSVTLAIVVGYGSGVGRDLYFGAFGLKDPGADLGIGDEDALGADVSCADEADDLLAGIGEAMEVALVGGGLDAEDGTDVLCVVLHDRPPV